MNLSGFSRITLWFCIIFLFACSTNDQPQPEGNLQFLPETTKGAPGYFRVSQSADGQWWFLDPDDQPFLYQGVCAVNRAGTAGGRRARDGSYAQVIDDKYDYQANPDSFVEAQFVRLREWGFNALGAWTTEEFFDRGMPYTEILEFFKEGPMLDLPDQRRPMPDIFDPAWVEAINSKARTLCATKRHSRDLVGYFTDNEIGFGRAADVGLDLGFETGGRFGYSLLRTLLGLEEGVPARERAWAFLLDRYDNLEALSDAWGQHIRSARDLRKLNQQKVVIDSEAYATDAKDFQLLYAEHYFRTTYETIKRYDPNHLVMGCRFGAPPDTAVLRVIAPWMDVISQNNYRPTLYQRLDYLYQHTGLPVLVGEFSWNPDLFKYVPLPDEPTGGYSIRERVFRRGEDVLLRAATHPAFVGYTWYRWVANTTQEEAFSFGLVNRDDEVEMHIPALKQVHAQMEPLRRMVAGQEASLAAINTGTAVIFLHGMRPDWDHELNIQLTDGQWAPKSFGWQMEATTQGGQLDTEGGSLEIHVDFKEWYWQGNLALEAGKGDYALTLERDGQYLSGSFTGTYNGQPVSGTVEGYFLPALPEMNTPEISAR